MGVSFPGEAVSPTFPLVRLASAGLCLLFSNFRFGTHRRAGCVKAYPAETTEAFLDGHVSAFAFFGGVPLSILYDNLKIAVARILGDGKRQRTHTFTELVSHYLFEDRFGRPGKGNDKGKVEALVKYSRANFLTPVPHAPSFEALNAALEERCRRRLPAGRRAS